ncbi:MAG: deoxyribose-phosphate aldolase [Armatimonadota bacterium]
MFTKEQFCKLIDNTYLRPTGTKDDITRFCDECKKYHFAAVVVFPFWLPLVASEMEDSDVKICTPIGFPYGATSRAAKVYEARTAVANGADELDIVINVGALKSGDHDFVRREIADIVSAANVSGMSQESNRVQIKVIIETPYLSEKEKIAACKIAVEAGADFIKTSTGTAPNGATVEDIRLIRNVVGPAIGVKAAGGIRTLDHAINLLDAGANRLGTSAGVALVQAYKPDEVLKSTR